MPKKTSDASEGPQRRPAKSTPDRPSGPARSGRQAPGRRKPDTASTRKAAKRASRPSGRTVRRVILLALMIVPLGLIVLLLRQPPVGDPLLELAFYVFGVPIVAVNLWEWAAVRVLERPTSEGTKK